MEVRVMTFNLRFENDRDGENVWRNRKNLVVEVIERFTPSLLGTQEGTPAQLRFLDESLSGYRMHAPNRVWDDTCQYPTIFYREDMYRAMEGGESWLSCTPGVHRSKGWDSAFPRMMSYGLFEEIRTKRSVWAAVTHLDHIGVEARREQARIIADWMCTREGPRILMGDFNDIPASDAHGILTGSGVGLEDTWELLERAEDDRAMTHHDFHGVPQQCRMDWILVGPDFQVIDACIVRDQSEGRYPSDHFPYAAILKWRAAEGETIS